MKKLVKLAIIFLAIMLTTCPVYADNAKRGKKQKTKEQIEIEKAENEKKYQIGCIRTAEEGQ